jgi:hypothetical protein
LPPFKLLGRLCSLLDTFDLFQPEKFLTVEFVELRIDVLDRVLRPRNDNVFAVFGNKSCQ